MSLDYRLNAKNQTGKLTYEKLQSLIASEFEITAYKVELDSQLVSFSLKPKDGKESIEFTLLKDGGYVVNLYNYDKEAYQKILCDLARLARLLDYSLLDIQTQETIDSPDPETIVTPKRLEILEAQAGNVKSLSGILKQADQWRKNNKPL